MCKVSVTFFVRIAESTEDAENAEGFLGQMRCFAGRDGACYISGYVNGGRHIKTDRVAQQPSSASSGECLNGIHTVDLAHSAFYKSSGTWCLSLSVLMR